MGEQIIKQSDGLYAIFSSITDTITVYDATAQEIEDYYAERAARDARRRVQEVLEHVANDQPRKAYYQFAMTWEQALGKDREYGGEAWQEWAQRKGQRR